MFKFINKVITGVFNMISRTTMKQVLRESPAITSTMVQKINEWNSMLSGNADWCKDYVKSLRIEQGICREFADVVLSEMEIKISNDKLLKLFEKTTESLNENLQDGLGLGSFCLKPLGNEQAEFVTADKFIPVSFGNDEKPNDIVFLDFRDIDDSKYYVRLERHSIKNGFLEITNEAYSSSTRYGFDRKIPLESLEAWRGLPEHVAYPGVKEMDFGYYRNPIKNRIDDTPCGVSIFDYAIDLIRKADVQSARIDWEFESGERAIHVDAAAIKRESDGQNGVSKLNKRLYRGIDGEEGFFKEFSPELRDQNLINGLENYFRQIEFVVGLAFGDLSNPQSVDKTATEVKASKNRKYNRVKAIQDNLRDCFEDFVRGLAFHEGMLHSGYEFICSFKDSILTDEEADRQLMLNEIAAGIRSHWEYRVRFLGEDEKTAKANVPDQGGVME